MVKNKQKNQAVSYDHLTHLIGRNVFIDALTQALERDPLHQKSALLLLDIDDFQDINLRLGHAAGDKLLILFAERMQNVIGEQGLLARLDGDEFAIFISDIQDVNDIERWSKKLIDTLANPYHIGNQEVIMYSSIGATMFDCDGRPVDEVLQYAEMALNKAKQDGKHCFRHFAAEMSATVQRRLSLGQHLQMAAVSGFSEFYLNYQPRVDLATGKVTGVEALARWHSPVFGEVPPVEFIPLAEQNDTIILFGEWVLQQACHQTQVWQSLQKDPLSVAVNVSAKQFRSVGFIPMIMRVLQQTQLPAERLEIELTESILIQDLPQTIQTLNALKELGIKLAIDDFGTGYSSLSYLKDFPLDYLKFDRSFVLQIPNSEKEVAIVKLIINMAHLLGVKVIAEGVEFVEQYEFLLAQDCDEVQGYLFSPPITGQSISEYLLQEGNLNHFAASLIPN